jgi:DNA-directed RNA polymerase specialized sigma24 family protein
MPVAPPPTPASPQNPDDPDVWKRAYLELLPAARRQSHDLGRARDLLQKAMLKARAPGPACWDPARGRLAPYLQSLLGPLAANERTRAVYRRETHDDLSIGLAKDPTPSALDELVARERVRQEAEVVDELRAELASAKDKDAVRVLDVIGDDVFKLSQVAAATGLSVAAVANARKRIARAYGKVLARRQPEGAPSR